VAGRTAPVTRLMSPSDFGRDPEALRFSRTFLTMRARRFNGPLHSAFGKSPTLTYVGAEGSVSYIDPDQR